MGRTILWANACGGAGERGVGPFPSKLHQLSYPECCRLRQNSPQHAPTRRRVDILAGQHQEALVAIAQLLLAVW